jgi:hypothetical protein
MTPLEFSAGRQPTAAFFAVHCAVASAHSPVVAVLPVAGKDMTGVRDNNKKLKSVHKKLSP